MDGVKMGDQVEVLRQGADVKSKGVVVQVTEARFWHDASIFHVWCDDFGGALLEFKHNNGFYKVVSRPESAMVANSHVMAAVTRYEAKVRADAAQKLLESLGSDAADAALVEAGDAVPVEAKV